MKKNPAYPWFDILMIIVVPKQYRNSRSCSTRQVLPKILQIHKKINARWSFFSKLCLERNPMAGGFSSNLLKPSRTPSIQNTSNNNNNNNDNDKQRILQY